MTNLRTFPAVGAGVTVGDSDGATRMPKASPGNDYMPRLHGFRVSGPCRMRIKWLVDGTPARVSYLTFGVETYLVSQEHAVSVLVTNLEANASYDIYIEKLPLT